MPYPWDKTQAGPNTELPPDQPRVVSGNDGAPRFINNEADDAHRTAGTSLTDYIDPDDLDFLRGAISAASYVKYNREVRRISKPVPLRNISDIVRQGPGYVLGLEIGLYTPYVAPNVSTNPVPNSNNFITMGAANTHAFVADASAPSGGAIAVTWAAAPGTATVLTQSRNPVIPNMPYAFALYANPSWPTGSITISVRFDDMNGQSIGAATTSNAAPMTPGSYVEVGLVAVAPVGAVYAHVTVALVDGATPAPAGSTLNLSSFITEEGSSVPTWAQSLITAGFANPGVVRLHDGVDINGPVIGTVITASTIGQASQNFPTPVRFTHGLYAEVISGFDTGVVYLEEEHHA